MTERDVVADQARTFFAMADPTRLRLLKLLADNGSNELCVNAMAGWLGVSQPAVSQHLRVLRGAGLINGVRRGYHVHYTIEPEAMKHCQEMVAAALGAAEPAEPVNCRNVPTGKTRCAPGTRRGAGTEVTSQKAGNMRRRKPQP